MLRLVIALGFILSFTYGNVFTQETGAPVSSDLFCEVLTNPADAVYTKEFDRVYREINKYTLSDSLWLMWNALVDSQRCIANDDSADALQRLVRGSQKAKQAIELININSDTSVNVLEMKRLKLKSLLELEKARIELEESLKLNPLDQRTQNYLIWIYQKLADLHSEQENYERASALLENLAYIIKDDPHLHYKLGENYLWLEQWANARSHFQKSINLILDTDWEKINTQELFSHYSYRALAETKLGLVAEALVTLNYAKLIAPSTEDEQKIQWQIDWITWDDGNLENSKRYDELKEEFRTGSDYRQLTSGFLDLHDRLSSVRAKDELSWQIAKLEFQYLNQKIQAINRLYQVMKEMKLDSLGYAGQAEYQKYLNDYGLMCYNMGIDHLRHNNRKIAYAYFYQSTRFRWNGIGKSFIQLAYLSVIKNAQVIDYCKKALQYKDTLSATEIQQLYHLLFDAYKSNGEFDVASQWYHYLVNSQ